ncbi:response regulator transcription factor [Xylanimonas ulmi]|nr:response regulator transcription factor [Xylanibacterium ulmi]
MRILLAEDERALADGLADGLRREGYLVDVAYDGAAALVALGAADTDVLVLDRDLPVLSGDAVCRTLRAQGHPVRILMLTAAGALDDRVAGLDLGADDYLTKPFAYVELLARLRALGRRLTPSGPMAVFEAGGIRLDTVRRTAERDGTPLALTPKEHGVLEVLLAADGAWVSVDEIVEDVWEQPDERRRTVVKATVHTLRRKLGVPDPIESAPGFGYRIGPRA